MNQDEGSSQNSGDAPEESILTENLLEGWLLVLLSEEPLHGYALLKKLEDLPCAPPHQTTVYRHLASLEERKLLDSNWQMRKSSPPTRTYQLTERGRKHLQVLYARISHLSRLCRAFLQQASQNL